MDNDTFYSKILTQIGIDIMSQYHLARISYETCMDMIYIITNNVLELIIQKEIKDND